MKLTALYPTITTNKLQESSDFYRKIGFTKVFENEFYIHMAWPDSPFQIAFLAPGHASQPPAFQKAYGGQGIILGLEVDEVDQICETLRTKGFAISVEPQDEEWASGTSRLPIRTAWRSTSQKLFRHRASTRSSSRNRTHQ